MKNKSLLSFVALICLLSALCGPLFFIHFSYAEIFKKNTVLMGTDIEIIISHDNKKKANIVFNSAIKEMERIENEMSEWREETPVSIINQKAGKEAVAVPEELFKIISAAQKFSELSNGAFDISWAGMMGLWKFSKGEERVPSPEEIRQRLPLVNYKNIELNEAKKTVFLKKEGMAIGLGGIAKGYAIDMAIRAIVNLGIKNAIVKAGGDMRIQGTKSGKPWDIGIKHPRDKKRLLGKLNLSNISISTSGDYERFFIKDGILYHHIMDTKTGYPARGCQSVTILAADTMTSDALSTAVFVLGPEEGMKLIKNLPGIEGIIVDGNGNIHYSAGIK